MTLIFPNISFRVSLPRNVSSMMSAITFDYQIVSRLRHARSTTWFTWTGENKIFFLSKENSHWAKVICSVTRGRCACTGFRYARLASFVHFLLFPNQVFLLLWFIILHHILLSGFFNISITTLISMMFELLVLETTDKLPYRIYQMRSIFALISFITIAIASIIIFMKFVIHFIYSNQIMILTHSMVSIVIRFMTKPFKSITLNASIVCSLISKFISLKTITIKIWLPLCIMLTNQWPYCIGILIMRFSCIFWFLLNFSFSLFSFFFVIRSEHSSG